MRRNAVRNHNILKFISHEKSFRHTISFGLHFVSTLCHHIETIYTFNPKASELNSMCASLLFVIPEVQGCQWFLHCHKKKQQCKLYVNLCKLDRLHNSNHLLAVSLPISIYLIDMTFSGEAMGFFCEQKKTVLWTYVASIGIPGQE